MTHAETLKMFAQLAGGEKLAIACSAGARAIEAYDALQQLLKDQQSKLAEQDRKIRELAEELKALELKQAGIPPAGW